MNDDVKPTNPNTEAVHREMRRRSLDTIRIFNPLDHDKVIKWDGFPHVVKSKSDASFPRYLAEKATREIIVDMINSKTQTLLDKELKERRDKGQKEFDPYERNDQIINKLPKTSDEALLKELYPIVWLGLEREYGLDYSSETPDQQNIDQRTVHERILADLDKKYEPSKPFSSETDLPPTEPSQAATEPAVEVKQPKTKKDEMVEEVTAND